MKKILTTVLLGALLVSALPAAAVSFDTAAPDLTDTIALMLKSPVAMVKGEKKAIDSDSSVVPFLKNETTLVPLRFLSETMGARVFWDEETGTASIDRGGKTVIAKIGEEALNIDGSEIPTDAPVLLRNGRTFVPLRAIGEALGMNVFYYDGIILMSATREFTVSADAKTASDLSDELYGLPTVGTEEMLADLLSDPIATRLVDIPTAESDPYRRNYLYNHGGAGSGSAAGSSSGSSSGGSFSETNVQVAGVDEADVVKTDGSYIYALNSEGNITIVAVKDMSLVSSIAPQQTGVPYTGFYVDGDRLVAIGTKQFQSNSFIIVKESSGGYPVHESKTIVEVYDLSDPAAPKLSHSAEISGALSSSRMTDGCLYFITNESIHTSSGKTLNPPIYTAGGISGTVPLDEIRYFPDGSANYFLNVASMDRNGKMEMQTFLGAGKNLYMGHDRLYAVNASYKYDVPNTTVTDRLDQAKDAQKRTELELSMKQEGTWPQHVMTDVYQFTLKEGRCSLTAKGTVKGRVINQFAMDEEEGYFRIATTSPELSQPESQLFVLDGALEPAGEVTGIARGENLYSCRFLGDKAYLITYHEIKKIDPLFVVDLSNPAAPAVLGELKLPGYITYLHPYDDSHLIGFGYTTNESTGQITGVKMDLYDVTAPLEPKVVDTVEWDGFDVKCPVLSNHKALLFDREKELLAFPLTQAGELPGAACFKITPEGFSARESISQAEENGTPFHTAIKRVLYINDNLYAVSGNAITRHDWNTSKQTGCVLT